MTVQQILIDVYETAGNLSDLNVYQADGVTFDLTTSGSVRLLQKLNEAQRQIAMWKDPVTGRITRVNSLISSMFFRTKVINDTVSSVSDTTFPYTIVLANSGGSLGATNDQYNEWLLEITSGSANGEVRVITDYIGASYTFYVNEDYDTNPSAADTVKLYKRWMYLLPSTHAFVSEHISLPAETDVSRADGNLIEVLRIEDVNEKTTLSKAHRTDVYSVYDIGYGDPTEYMRVGNKIYFDENQRDEKWFKMEYYRQPTDLTTAAAEPELPQQYHQALILYMLEWAYRRQQEFTAAYAMNQRLIQTMREIVGQKDIVNEREDPHGSLRRS